MDPKTRLAEVLPSVRADLEALVRIPSVSALPEHAEDVRRSAEATAELFRAEGFEVELLTVDGAPPAVVATRPAPAGGTHGAPLRPPRRAAGGRPGALGE